MPFSALTLAVLLSSAQTAPKPVAEERAGVPIVSIFGPLDNHSKPKLYEFLAKLPAPADDTPDVASSLKWIVGPDDFTVVNTPSAIFAFSPTVPDIARLKLKINAMKELFSKGSTNSGRFGDYGPKLSDFIHQSLTEANHPAPEYKRPSPNAVFALKPVGILSLRSNGQESDVDLSGVPDDSQFLQGGLAMRDASRKVNAFLKANPLESAINPYTERGAFQAAAERKGKLLEKVGGNLGYNVRIGASLPYNERHRLSLRGIELMDRYITAERAKFEREASASFKKWRSNWPNFDKQLAWPLTSLKGAAISTLTSYGIPKPEDFLDNAAPTNISWGLAIKVCVMPMDETMNIFLWP